MLATTNCPPPSSGYTWIKINWNANAGGQASNVSYTPLLNTNSSGTVSCRALNVSAQPRQVILDIFTVDGLSKGPITRTLQPGRGDSVGFFGGVNGTFYCKFTVTDGTSSDIRGSMQLCDANAGCGGGGGEIAAQ